MHPVTPKNNIQLISDNNNKRYNLLPVDNTTLLYKNHIANTVRPMVNKVNIQLILLIVPVMHITRNVFNFQCLDIMKSVKILIYINGKEALHISTIQPYIIDNSYITLLDLNV